MARKANGKPMDEQNGMPVACTAFYIRVSTDKQAEEGFSLEAQRQRLTSYCAAMGWAVCDDTSIYVDAGLSAKTTDRPAFLRMLQDAKAGKFQRVVSVALDRLARSTRDFLAIVDTLDKAGVAIVLLKQNFDTGTPQGRFALTMFAALAELEVGTIAERTMTGRIEKARQGGFNGSPVPFGYTRSGDGFVPDAHAETVRRVFADYLAGISINRIADTLNAETVPTATAARWYASTVSYVLHNGFYAGLVQYDGAETDGTHAALVSRSDYEAVQVKLSSRARR
jgi:site-specific DNA recombinase